MAFGNLLRLRIDFRLKRWGFVGDNPLVTQEKHIFLGRGKRLVQPPQSVSKLFLVKGVAALFQLYEKGPHGFEQRRINFRNVDLHGTHQSITIRIQPHENLLERLLFQPVDYSICRLVCEYFVCQLH